MGAGGYVTKAKRVQGVGSRSLHRFDTCSCHPKAWGLKKGLRRARRRLGKQIIQDELR